MCNCYMIWRSIVTIIFYLLDVISDIVNGVFFIQRGELIWGIATIVLMFLPALFNLILVASAYSKCFRESQENYEQLLLSVPWIRREASWKKRWLHYMLIFFRVGPIYSHIKLIRHGARKSQERFDFEMKTMAEMFLEVCLQSLPQTILQVYILGRENTVSGMQIVSIILSLAKTWYVLSSINFKKGKEKCQAKWWWWFVKFFWVFFGGMPFLLSSFPTISLFASVYGPFFLCFHLLAIFLFLVKWWWWGVPTKGNYDDFKSRTIYAFVVTIMKTIFTMLIIMWFVRVKKFQNPSNTYNSPLITKAIPPNVWPYPTTCLKSWANQSGDEDSQPSWANCDRSTMFRNGTFVVDINSWVAEGSIGSNVLDFLVQKDLFCLIDLADIIFVLIFYCLLISFFWDICYYILRIFVDPDECNSENYIINQHMNDMHEERIRLKNTDGNDNVEAIEHSETVSHI